MFIYVFEKTESSLPSIPSSGNDLEVQCEQFWKAMIEWLLALLHCPLVEDSKKKKTRQTHKIACRLSPASTGSIRVSISCTGLFTETGMKPLRTVHLRPPDSAFSLHH